MRQAATLALSLSLLAGGVATTPARLAAQDSTRATAPASQNVDSAISATVTSETRGRAPEEKGARSAQDIITPHITDSHVVEYPCPHRAEGFACEYELPRWAPIHVGGLTIDLSPTKHVIWMSIAAAVCALVLVLTARSHARRSREVGHPRGFATGIEAVVLFLRDTVVLRNVGPHGEKYVPFVLTLFFFILFANLFGLIPYGSTATGNISVTATLALITVLVVEISGARALGKGYIWTWIYWNKDLPPVMREFMAVIMTIVEILGKFTKGFALAVRLFANMIGGHVAVLAFIGLIFFFGSYFIAIGPLLLAVGLMLLELFVAFLQAFVFALLASVFIGQLRTAHH